MAYEFPDLSSKDAMAVAADNLAFHVVLKEDLGIFDDPETRRRPETVHLLGNYYLAVWFMASDFTDSKQVIKSFAGGLASVHGDSLRAVNFTRRFVFDEITRLFVSCRHIPEGSPELRRFAGPKSKQIDKAKFVEAAVGLGPHPIEPVWVEDQIPPSEPVKTTAPVKKDISEVRVYVRPSDGAPEHLKYDRALDTLQEVLGR